jgi:acetolactate synthase-1/2/3 large subunit
MSRVKKIDGGELVARTLRQAGVTKVFALHGGHLESFYRGCASNELHLVDTRHEASAGNAAEAYARVTGELGVCVVTAGPGFANALPAILNAYVDASPTLFLIGAAPLREAETNALQGGFDQVAIARPAAKWALTITNTERIPDLLASAVRRAMTGRRGPVVVELPIDVLHMVVPEERVSMPTGLLVRPRPAPSPQEIDDLIDRLVKAKRPVIIVGGDARFSDCGAALAAFAEQSGIPVFASKRGLGLLSAGHCCDAHEAANLGQLAALGQSGPDLVILAGTRLGLFLGGRGTTILPADAVLVQIYSDAAEIGRLREIQLPICADTRAFFEALLSASIDVRWPDWKAWTEVAVGLQNRHAAYPEVESPNGIHPYHAMRVVADVVGKEAVYAIDGGEAGQWAVQLARTSGPGRIITTGYFGGLGVGSGYAIGAQVAAPGRRVILVTGDGSFGFHLQELDTMLRHNLPIVVVILNNGIWGMSLHGQQIMYGKNYSSISILGERHYAAIAAAFGCYAERVMRYADIGPAMERALASGKPACIEIMTDGTVVSPGLVRMLGDASDDGKHIVIPYYENIPL